MNQSTPPGDKGERTPPARRRILAVVNPVSGVVPHDRTVRELEEAARAQGVDLDVVLTRKDLDGIAAVRSKPGPYDCYLAAGGDGTVMEVASAAVADEVPLAILPRGTANATAWHFTLPIDARQALKVAARGDVLRIDLARTPARDFLIMAGLGYDAHIIEGATRELKKRVGFLAYLYGALKGLVRRAYVFRVYLDDNPPERLTGIAAAVFNTGTLAGHIRPLRDASPRDGLLDVIVFSPENFGAFFRMVFMGMIGRLKDDPRVKVFRAKRVRIESRPAAPLEIDGDLIGDQRDLQVEVLPRALQLAVLSEGMSWLPFLPDRAKGGFPWGHGADRERTFRRSKSGSDPAVPAADAADPDADPDDRSAM